MNHRYPLVAVAITCAGAATLWYQHHAPAASLPAKQLDKRQVLSQLPVWFEETAGGSFATRGAGVSMVLGERGVAWRLSGGTIRMNWKGVSPSVRKHGVDRLSARVDSYKGNRRGQWRTNIPAFKQVAYESIYPGVDLKFYGKGNRMEHDFIVAPHADPKQIALQFSGASKISINNDGSLDLATGKDAVSLTAPVAYQIHGGTRQEVAARFNLAPESAEATFELGAYDANLPLVIDPVVIYGTYIGGSSSDEAVAVTVDLPNDSVWVAGSTVSSDFPTSGNGLVNSSVAGRDVWIAQFIGAGSGQLTAAYVSNVGGAGDEVATAIAVAPNGIVYVAGNTTSTDFPNVNSYTTVYGGGLSDTFVLGIDPSQTPNGTSALVYATFLGGSSEDHANGMFIDSNSIVYIAGDTDSSDFPTTANAILTTTRGGYDPFVYKLDTFAGTNGLLYSTIYGGTYTDKATSVAVDAQGLIYLAGWTFSPDFPVSGDVPNYGYIGSGDAFLARFDPNKSGLDGISFATFLGGSDYDEITRMQFGSDGNLYLAGYTKSPDLPIAGNAPQRKNAGGTDMFLMALNVKLAGKNWIVFSTYLGGSGDDIPYGMTLDAQNRVYLIGYTHPLTFATGPTFKAFPATANAVQTRSGGLEDAVMARINPAASPEQSLEFSSFWGGPSNDLGLGIAVDPRGCLIHAVGTTSNPNMFVVGYAYQNALSNPPDAFLITIDTCQPTPASGSRP
jgi:hypothetical protein